MAQEYLAARVCTQQGNGYRHVLAGMSATQPKRAHTIAISPSLRTSFVMSSLPRRTNICLARRDTTTKRSLVECVLVRGVVLGAGSPGTRPEGTRSLASHRQ